MRLYVLVFLSLLMLAGNCEPETPEIPNEEEVITTLIYTLTSDPDNSVTTLTFRDLDGDGGNAPVITGATLAANRTYSAQLTLQNEQEEPAEDITEEIEEEDEDHQFFFESTVPGLAVAYNDSDGAGNPVGLRTTLTTGDAGSGTLTITLRHEPSKSAAGVSDGNLDNAGGETDIEVTFDLIIQ